MIIFNRYQNELLRVFEVFDPRAKCFHFYIVARVFQEDASKITIWT